MSDRAPTLIDKMGGVDAASGVLISAVEILYVKLLSDPALVPFFEGVDIDRIKAKQVRAAPAPEPRRARGLGPARPPPRDCPRAPSGLARSNLAAELTLSPPTHPRRSSSSRTSSAAPTATRARTSRSRTSRSSATRV
jgi:hypothetical protein